MPDLVTFSELCGISVHWGNWGRIGDRKLDRGFHGVLTAALDDLFSQIPHGPPVGILSGGAYVPPPHPPRHSLGTAFDLSGLAFLLRGDAKMRVVVHWEVSHEHRAHPAQVLAVESVLRLHLPQVLGPWCNKDHEDHWHVDDREDARGFQERHPSDVRYLQACLHHVWREDCGGIDGKIGPQTLGAYARAAGRVGIADSPSLSWDAFLRATARGGLSAFHR